MKRSSFLCCTLLLSLWTTNIYADDPRLVVDVGGHTSIIKDVIFTRDGKYLVSAGDDKVIRVWEVATGKIARTIRGQFGDGPEGKIYAAALSPDNKYLAVGGWLAGKPEERHAIRIHDFQSGEVVGLLKGLGNGVSALAFSPDSRYLVSGSADLTVRVWDLASVPMKQVHVLPGHTGIIYAVAFSPDGRRIVSGSVDNTMRLWDARRGLLLKEMERRHRDAVTPEAGGISAVAFSPDGRYLASGSDDRRILLWDATTGEFRKELGKQEAEVTNLSFSPNGNWLVSGSGPSFPYTCNIFSIPSGQVMTRFKEHDNTVSATAISPDGKIVATAGGHDHLIHLWNPESEKIIRTLSGKGRAVWAVGFARDGKSIAFGDEYSYRNFNHRGPLQKAILLKQDSDYEVSLAGDVRDEKQFFRALEVHGDYRLKLGSEQFGRDPQLEITKGGRKHRVITRDFTSYNHMCYTFTPDGRYLVSGGLHGVLALYKTETGERVHEFVGHTSAIQSVAISPDNRTLVSGSDDQTVRLWDIETGKNLLTIFVASDREWVAWTPEGYYTSSLNGDKYIGWHLNQGVDKAAKYYSAAQFQKQFYRPDVIAEYLNARDIQVAVRRANEKRGGQAPGQAVASAATISSTLPPIIDVSTLEEEETTVENENLMIKAVVLSNTLPITSVKVSLNGIEVAALKGNPRRVPVEMQVQLQQGINTLSIVAANDVAISKPETRKIIYKPGPHSRRETDKSNLFVLAVGVSKYKHEGVAELEFADDDAKAIAEEFDKQKGRLFADVKTKVIPNDQATREEIIRGLNWLNREATQKDLRILFLSGHGGLDRQENYYFYSHLHDPNDDPETWDVRWDVILDKLKVIPSKTILFIDTCRAAAIAGNARRRSDVDYTKVLKDLKAKHDGLVIFAASTGREVSVERDDWKQGAFTKVLLEGLRGKARTQNGAIYTQDLGTWIIDGVKKLTSGDQHAIYDPPPDLPSFPIFVVP